MTPWVSLPYAAFDGASPSIKEWMDGIRSRSRTYSHCLDATASAVGMPRRTKFAVT